MDTACSGCCLCQKQEVQQEHNKTTRPVDPAFQARFMTGGHGDLHPSIEIVQVRKTPLTQAQGAIVASAAGPALSSFAVQIAKAGTWHL